MRTETLPAWRPRCRLSAGGCSPAASGRPAERREETVQSFRPELVVTDYTAGKTERRKENLLHWLEVRTADLTNECQRLRVLDPHDSFDVSLFFRDQNSKKKKLKSNFNFVTFLMVMLIYQTHLMIYCHASVIFPISPLMSFHVVWITFTFLDVICTVYNSSSRSAACDLMLLTNLPVTLDASGTFL